jgi:hypothetical protein
MDSARIKPLDKCCSIRYRCFLLLIIVTSKHQCIIRTLLNQISDLSSQITSLPHLFVAISLLFLRFNIYSRFLSIHRMASGAIDGDRFSKICEKGNNLKSSIVDQSRQIGHTITNAVDSAGNKLHESSTLTKACVIGSVSAVVAPLAIIPALGVAGFTSAGVTAGSIAASMQTAATASGTFFALCQSAGAVGAVATSTSMGVGLAAGVGAGGITTAVCMENKIRSVL